MFSAFCWFFLNRERNRLRRFAEIFRDKFSRVSLCLSCNDCVVFAVINTRFNCDTYLFTYLLFYLLIYLFTYLLIYLLTYLFTFLFTYFLLTYLLFTYLLIYLLIYLITYLLSYLLTYLLTYLLSYLLTYIHSYLLNYLLTYCMVQSPSWAANRFAASQEIPRISRNPNVHYRTHKRPLPVSILGQPNPVHIPTSHLLEIHPNIIHPSTPRSHQWSPSLRSPTKTLYTQQDNTKRYIHSCPHRAIRNPVGIAE